MNYLDAINKVLEHEGGYVNNPLDTGGRTNFGITQATYEKFLGRKLSSAEADSVMKNMPKGNAVAIYKTMYWDAIQGDKIKQYAIAAIIFDQAVNRGVSAAVKQAQRILGLAQDGKIGPVTIATLNGVKDTDFIPKYLTESINAYKTIVANNPSQSVFLNGWLKRVESLKSYAANLFGSINATTVGIGVVAVVGASVLGYIIYQYMTNAPRMA
jgi:lysozyme family protein